MIQEQCRVHIHPIFEVIDNLIADFDKRFNKEIIAVVDASKCLHPYDSFKSFDEHDLKILYDHYADDFQVHDDLNLTKTDHTYYKNMLLK